MFQVLVIEETAQEGKNYPDTTDIYKQRFEKIDLVAIIKAANSLE